MKALSTAQIQNLEQNLRQRYQFLRQEVREKLRDSQDKDFEHIAGKVHDAGDESIADLLIGLATTSLEKEVQEIRDIEAALARINAKSYGVCIDCQADIALQRLQAYPTAKRCITCQTKYEDKRSSKDATPSL